jgi:hypothetical protein
MKLRVCAALTHVVARSVCPSAPQWLRRLAATVYDHALVSPKRHFVWVKSCQ